MWPVVPEVVRIVNVSSIDIFSSGGGVDDTPDTNEPHEIQISVVT